MSQLKAKQIAGPSNGSTGSALLFDGTKSGWSTDLNSSLALPSGPISARPQDAAGGHIRHNNETNKLEGYNGTAWVDLGISKFSELSDGPGALQAGKGLRVNAGGTAIEHYTLSSGMVRYRFRINYVGSTNPTSFSEVPTGWTITMRGASVTDISITHNLNKAPTQLSVFGLTSAVGGTTYSQRLIIGTNTGLPTALYDTANINQFWITQMTAANNNTASGGHAYIDVFFLND